MVNRRDFICHTLFGLGLAPSWLTHAAKPPRPVHEDIAQRAREYTEKNARELKVLLPRGCESNVKPVVDAFHRLSGHRASFIVVDVDEVITEMLLSSASKRYAFDIALPPTFGISDLADKGVIQALDAFQNRYEPKDFDRHFLYRAGANHEGKFYGYHVDGDAYLMFYNQAFWDNDSRKDYEDKFGVALGIPKHWIEFDRQVQHFHAPEKQRFGAALYRNIHYGAWEWYLRLHSKGQLPFDENFEPQIDSEAAVAALEDMLRINKSLYPGARSNGLLDNWRHYAKGNIYANIGWGGTCKYLRTHMTRAEDNLLTALPPGMDNDPKSEGLSYFNWGWNYTISAYAKEPELAYLFSLFASCAEPSIESIRASDGFFDPWHSEHYNDTKIQQVYGQNFLQAHKNAMQNAIPDLYISGWSDFFETLKKYLARAFDKQLTPKEALRIVNVHWQNQIRLRGRERLASQWQALQSYYPWEISRARSTTQQ